MFSYWLRFSLFILLYWQWAALQCAVVNKMAVAYFSKYLWRSSTILVKRLETFCTFSNIWSFSPPSPPPTRCWCWFIQSRSTIPTLFLGGGMFGKLNNDFTLQNNASPFAILSSVLSSFVDKSFERLLKAFRFITLEYLVWCLTRTARVKTVEKLLSDKDKSEHIEHARNLDVQSLARLGGKTFSNVQKSKAQGKNYPPIRDNWGPTYY